MAGDSDNGKRTTTTAQSIASTSDGAPRESSKQEPNGDGSDNKDAQTEQIFQINVLLPQEPHKITVMVSYQEPVQDLRQSIVELPETLQYSCFHLEHAGQRVNDFVELSEIGGGFGPGSDLHLLEDPYTEKEARMAVLRVRDLVGAAGDRSDAVRGISAGMSLHDSVAAAEAEATGSANNGATTTTTTTTTTTGGSNHNGSINGHNGSSSNSSSNGSNNENGNKPPTSAGLAADYDFEAPASLRCLQEPQPANPSLRTIKSLSVSPWNPPPPHLRQRGHLLYLQLTTNEGEQFQITSHVSGFFVNRSSNSKFDPFPRQAPKNASAHSLLNLLDKVSPSFDASFRALQELDRRRDPLATTPVTNALPCSPWLVSAEAALTSHQADLSRTQDAYLAAGVDSADTLRDWNEEFQSTRELPRESVQDRVFRERIAFKLSADYAEAAARGAAAVIRGEVAPLNPTERADAQIFVHSNVFYSFGADGVGIFGSEGGDEAARAAVGRDVAGVRLVNQLDLSDLHTPGTAVVDYLGRRLVCQSIVPGIFKQREPGEHQVDYGGVEGRDVVAVSPQFAEPFANLSRALRVKPHPVWDAKGEKHPLEASVETKGLLGTDGRKYVLDLYRLTPLDVLWLEEYWVDDEGEKDDDAVAGASSSSAVGKEEKVKEEQQQRTGPQEPRNSDPDRRKQKQKPRDKDYPHRMAVLRHELVEAFWRSGVTEYVTKELERRKAESKNADADSNEGREQEKEEGKQQNGEKGNSTVMGKENAIGQEVERTERRAGGEEEGGDEKTAGPMTDDKKGEAAVDDKETRTNGEDHRPAELKEGNTGLSNGETATKSGANESPVQPLIQSGSEQVDISGFQLALNPDVFCGQVPQTEEEKRVWAADEEQVRSVCRFLLETAIPDLIRDMREGEVGFPMDGQSLTRLMHKRGINMRYLGRLAKSTTESEMLRLKALGELAVQEMIARAFKHVAAAYVRKVPAVFATACYAHLLNCLLGAELNDSPKVALDDELQSLYPHTDWSFVEVTPQRLRSEVELEVHRRYRYDLIADWSSRIKHIQLLREVSLKMGLQLLAKDYRFTTAAPATPLTPGPATVLANGTNGATTNGTGHSKKKKKNGDHELSKRSEESLAAANAAPPVTFEADDIVNILPIVKDSCPRSVLAEEALEAGRMSIAQDANELGLELLLESLSLHEQIYGMVHPEVARVYHQLAMLYYQLGDKNSAVELSRKAVIVSERTLGIDCNETIISYLNLGLFEQSTGNAGLALRYILHALELWKVVYGGGVGVGGHPDSITTVNNGAVMLQHLKRYRESREWFEKSLEICERVSGPTSVASATLRFQLAQALALDHDAKAAVNRMREAYSIFLQELGPDDRNTRQSEDWLEQLTQNAVSIAKHAKDVQTRRTQLFGAAGSARAAASRFAVPRVTLAARPQMQVGQASADVSAAAAAAAVAAAVGASGKEGGGARGGISSSSSSGAAAAAAATATAIDSRSLDELIRFIEGGAPMSSSKVKSMAARVSGASGAGSGSTGNSTNDNNGTTGVDVGSAGQQQQQQQQQQKKRSHRHHPKRRGGRTETAAAA